MIELVTLSLSVVAATTAALGLVIGYLNHRDRVRATEQNELPKIQMYGSGASCSFRLETDHKSIGWKVVGVKVIDSDYRECLKQYVWRTENDVTTYGPIVEWRDFCDYPEGSPDLPEILFHPNCDEAYLWG